MKKMLISLTVVGCLGLFALQQAHAGRGRNAVGPGGCPGWNSGYGQVQGNVSQKDIDAFLQATTDLRKQMAMKQAEYQAVMNADNPDPAKAAAISGEIYQLRDQIRTKAREAGLGAGFCGGGYGCGGGWGNGYGPGGGRGMCRGFMY